MAYMKHALGKTKEQRLAMPNLIVHFEIGCRDRGKTQTFFSKLFDWQMEETGPATMIRTGGDFGGYINALGHEPHHYTIFYVQVDDVQTYLDKASALGGKTRVPRSTYRPAPSPGSPIPRAIPSACLSPKPRLGGCGEKSSASPSESCHGQKHVN